MASSAGTVSIVEETFGSIKKVKWSFVCGSGASVNNIGSAQTTYAYNGLIQGLTTVGASGSTAPSASWDLTIKDQSSVDILMGAGGSRAATTQHTLAASLGCVTNDKLTLAVSNCGSSNAGAVYLYIR